MTNATSAILFDFPVSGVFVDPFSDLVTRLRDGDDRAAQQVFDRFVSRLIALAKSQIDACLRSKNPSATSTPKIARSSN
jgi:hypothetical protein